MSQILEDELLNKVTKPTRYTGGEYNQVKKDWSTVNTTMAFAFPDVYEVGMSHLGLRILYHLINDQENMLMERVFAPWIDMEEELRKREIPLFSLESRRPLKDFDVIGFTLQYEMSYSNILNMLDLADIPLWSYDRTDEHPLIIAGGPCAVNPEPLADFLDLVILGEGEESLPKLLEAIGNFKQAQGWRRDSQRDSRKALLRELAQLPGIYVPSLYQPHYNDSGHFVSIERIDSTVPAQVSKQVVADLDKAYFPTKSMVPFMGVVHDRIMLEVLRGCSRACRFCQAGSIYRPVRERSMETLKKQAEELIQQTGYDEIALTSLSTADYSCVEPLLKDLLQSHEEKRVGVSLPSLRVDAFSVDLAKEVQKVRKTGLTFAPEAGTQRLRDVINKGVTEEDLMETIEKAFQGGWHTIKLYFMMGLPTEEEEDLEGIARLAEQVAYVGSDIFRSKGIRKAVKVTVSVSSFVPKPQTPFQWEPQDRMALLEEKQQFLKKRIRDRRITYNWHDSKVSFIEAVMAKGDRNLGKVLYKAWENGAKFDGWTEHFRFERWQEAFQAEDIDPEYYAYRKIEYDEPLPWEHLNYGVSRSYLVKEHKKAIESELTDDCRHNKCSACGVCSSLGISVDLRGGDHGQNSDRL
ncbi:TIGR03960 family B12-binding radical SAM protein [Heliorestis acidaminivorans]|uniref:TIGR03960 family B12-binding radical SAM protein n=1 Tax=Heliorestis acidaminivorans TaxID=553427 RepID=A0A6I0EZM6_9FIRM|nr:TIGR03960 family B12-binding radical SAM protein [Heliorestis acidaminivorans]